MKLKYKNYEDGFFSIHFIFFISLISITLMSYEFVFYAQKQKDQFRKICYFDLVDIQKQMIQTEKQLFLLNSESTALRLKIKWLYIQLAAATAAQDYPVVAKISIDIQNTISLQKKLDLLQKMIIQKGTRTAQLKLINLSSDIKKQNENERIIWGSVLTDKRNYNLSLSPIFAVRPDSIGGLAPNYELLDNYQKLQELNLDLQYEFNHRSENQTLLPVKQSFQFSCQVSFIQKDQKWELKINQDRLLSKQW